MLGIAFTTKDYLAAKELNHEIVAWPVENDLLNDISVVMGRW